MRKCQAESGRLVLYECSWGSISMVEQDWQHALLPGGVHSDRLLHSVGPPCPKPVLSVKPDAQVAEPAPDVVAFAAADDVNLCAWTGDKSAQQSERLGVRLGQLRNRRERHQAAVVVEQQDKGLAPAIRSHERTDRPGSRRRVGRTLVAASRRESVQKGACPAVNVEAHHPPPERAHPSPAFIPRHDDGVVVGLGHVDGVEGIDVHGLG